MAALSQSHKCREAVYVEILAMVTAATLPDITSDQVKDKLLLTDVGVLGSQGDDTTSQAICVCFPADLPISLIGGTNITEDLGIPIVVAALAKAAGSLDPSTLSDRIAYWIEQVILHFHSKRLPGVTTVEIVQAEPLPMFSQEDFETRDILITGTILRCISRMQRV